MDRDKIRLFSTSIPRIDELRCIICRISSTEIKDASVKSLYHRRILNCRLLIHLIPEIIASPITRGDERGDIYILSKTDFITTGKIQSELNDLNIKYSEFAEVVTKRVYEACISYTILVKLSPQWNKVDEYFIKGKYFLTYLSYPKNAIKMRVTVTEEETRLSVSPADVQVPTLSLGYFNLSERSIKKFLTNDNGLIILNSSESRSWVYVLPSLTRGKVVSISKKIPETSPFRDYQQLQRHWKNMYGYTLPDTDNGLIYYQISFPGLGPTFFTYPNCCVRSGKLENHKLDNAKDTVNQFMKNLTEKLPNICGNSLILKELDTRPSHNIIKKEIEKENIQNVGSSVAYNVGEILNQRETSHNVQPGLNPDLKLSGNYIHPFDKSFNETSSYRSAFSMMFDNSASLKPARNIIKDKNLREALNMKPFLQAQSRNRKGLPIYSHEFHSVIGNTPFKELSNISEIGSSSYGEGERSRKLSFPESFVKVEMACSSQSMKTEPDKSSAAEEAREENESFYHSLLRSRSSFDLKDFGTELGREKDENLISETGEEVEIKSHYFKDLENGAQSNDKGPESDATSSSKLNLYRLRNRQTMITPKVSGSKSERKDRSIVKYKTNDISSYFTERKQMKVSDLKTTVMKTSAPKLIQTQLNIKRSGEVELKRRSRDSSIKRTKSIIEIRISGGHVKYRNNI